ncbi:hypothetical protein Hanom_Chr11g01010211 [Helianthus anomalus]
MSARSHDNQRVNFERSPSKIDLQVRSFAVKKNNLLSPTCVLVVGDFGFPIETQVQFSLVSYLGGYWAMMVTNSPRGVRS